MRDWTTDAADAIEDVVAQIREKTLVPAKSVCEALQAGGQLMLTTDVENFPGFPDGILGPDLMATFRQQAERFGAEFVTADVDAVDLSGPPFRVHVGNVEHTAKAIIISTGAQ